MLVKSDRAFLDIDDAGSIFIGSNESSVMELNRKDIPKPVKDKLLTLQTITTDVIQLLMDLANKPNSAVA